MSDEGSQHLTRRKYGIEHNPVVYFVKAVHVSGPYLIKIVYSAWLPRRMLQLRQSRVYEDMLLMSSAPGDKIEEAILHSAFAKQRFRDEWFYANDTLVNLANYCKNQGSLPDIIIDTAALRRAANDADQEATQAMWALSDLLPSALNTP